jgi:D-serine deaminase-like pyridoxal phosphate-dependent protein
MKKWYEIENEELISTPSLLVFPLRIKKNIESMINISGGIDRLWPHIKTHKMPEVVRLQMDYGIRRFKCSTIAEIELLINCKVDKILFTIQPSKEKFLKILHFQKLHPKIEFSTLVDNADSLKMFSEISSDNNQKMKLWLDINSGMNRTGIEPNNQAVTLYLSIFKENNLSAMGLHVYDGHIRSHDLNERQVKCNESFKSISDLIKKIENKNYLIPNIIAGGSPTFHPHSNRKKIILSPGTTLLWDLGYKNLWKESPFLNAAILISRLISKPKKNFLCLDLGHKAIGSEMPLPRAEIFGLESAKHISQSEEHLVIETPLAKNYKIGHLFYLLPYHICPTVAKYNMAFTILNSRTDRKWKITARDYITND